MDLSNDIHCCKTWDSNHLKASFQEHIPPPKALPIDILFVQAIPVIVDIPDNYAGKPDIYIDDLTMVVVNIGGNL